jgi:hypothetical protein
MSVTRYSKFFLRAQAEPCRKCGQSVTPTIKTLNGQHVLDYVCRCWHDWQRPVNQ